LKQNGK